MSLLKPILYDTVITLSFRFFITFANIKPDVGDNTKTLLYLQLELYCKQFDKRVH